MPNPNPLSSIQRRDMSCRRTCSKVRSADPDGGSPARSAWNRRCAATSPSDGREVVRDEDDQLATARAYTRVVRRCAPGVDTSTILTGVAGRRATCAAASSRTSVRAPLSTTITSKGPRRLLVGPRVEHRAHRVIVRVQRDDDGYETRHSFASLRRLRQARPRAPRRIRREEARGVRLDRHQARTCDPTPPGTGASGLRASSARCGHGVERRQQLRDLHFRGIRAPRIALTPVQPVVVELARDERRAPPRAWRAGRSPSRGRSGNRESRRGGRTGRARTEACRSTSRRCARGWRSRSVSCRPISSRPSPLSDRAATIGRARWPGHRRRRRGNPRSPMHPCRPPRRPSRRGGPACSDRPS